MVDVDDFVVVDDYSIQFDLIDYRKNEQIKYEEYITRIQGNAGVKNYACMSDCQTNNKSFSIFETQAQKYLLSITSSSSSSLFLFPAIFMAN